MNKLFVLPLEEPSKAHMHAESMRLYAEDATKTDKPWLLWEMFYRGYETVPCQSNPSWETHLIYRRKPVKIRTLFWVNIYKKAESDFFETEEQAIKAQRDGCIATVHVNVE